MKFELMDGVTLETTDEVLVRVLTVIEHVKAVIKAYNELPYDEVLKATGYDWHKISELMECCHYEDSYKPYRDLVSDWYWEESEASDKAYRRHVRADFEAYEQKHVHGTIFVGTEDDFSFYSDWHKDFYGYRPHYITKRVESI